MTYSAPITITQGGTYTGNFKSTNSRVPCITIQTTQPVIIENCILAGAGDLILANAGGYNLTVRNNRGYGLQQSIDNERHGRFLEVNSAKSVTVENNYFEHTTGIAIYMWSGDGSPAQTLKVRRNMAKNIDGRYRNGGGTFCNFLSANKVANLANVEVAWNQVVNEPNNSLVEDNINFYNSGGTAQSPINVHDNYVQGAYPYPATGNAFTGTGMIIDGTGDSQQGYLDAMNNQFVSTCNSAMNIAGGHHVRFNNNRMVTSGLLPNGQKLNATYCGIAVFNFYQQAVFGSHQVDGNVMGMVKWGANNPFPDRNDNGDYGFQIHTNTQHLPNPITLQTEQAEWTRWVSKLQQNGITIGTGPNTNGGGGGGGGTTNQAPTVSLTSPGNSSVTVNTVLNLTATAADADGSVAKVEFFNGSTKLGEDTSAPYQLSYTAAAAGTLTLSARATDNVGATTNSGSVTVTVTSVVTPPVAGSFYRAINVNGPAITLDGNAWQASSGASGVQIIGTPFANQNITLNPATDATRASMIRSSVYGNTTGAAITVPNGTYQVYMYLWEDNNPETYNILVEGQTVRSGYNSGSAGKWEKVGPFTANVTDGTLNASTSGGHANLSGIELWAGSATPTNQAPTVSLTAPAASTVTVGAVLNLAATAADADGSVAKVEFFNGSTKLGEDTSAPYQLSYTAASAGTLTLSARATDNAGATTNSGSVTVTVNAPVVTSTATFYRAINVNGPAITLDGNAWQASSGASGVQIIGTPFANQNITLNPATDATRASMIRSSVYGNTTGMAMSNVPSGTYKVYLYVWEDNNPETYNILVEGQTVRSGYNSGSAGKWEKVGPFTANVTDGTLNVTTSGGYANLSGIEVWRQTTGTATSTQSRFDLNSSSPMVASVSAYPSPMTNELSIELNAAQTETMRVAILNQSGAVVQNSDVAFTKGVSNDKLNVSSLPAGNYFLRFTNGSLAGKSIQVTK
ncbi:Ig-like domain-containing protein [Hymenobacter metallicola]|uniref:T9SS type A sorting domain-containing protein n=1 Tax=Hymenobacter metallicola TaxID=2563114 RepID=A0A4Z0QHW2_9BACT|nr:Ig-like domain-containing protein [Hymenobacter metallicola]TGE29295.1 T9SS type A sorting domain-containing protein [Hymenobacter metallicola]